ncbi:hypothetical protein CALCODRAFT_521555, partial [Calocera cornea HHB12733]
MLWPHKWPLGGSYPPEQAAHLAPYTFLLTMRGLHFALCLCFTALIVQGLHIPQQKNQRQARDVAPIRFKRATTTVRGGPTTGVAISDVPGAPIIPISPTVSHNATAAGPTATALPITGEPFGIPGVPGTLSRNATAIPTAAAANSTSTALLSPFDIPGVPGSLSRNATSSPTTHVSIADVPGVATGVPGAVSSVPLNDTTATGPVRGGPTTGLPITDVPGAPLRRAATGVLPPHGGPTTGLGVTGIPGAPTGIPAPGPSIIPTTGTPAAAGTEYTCSSSGLTGATGACCTGFGPVGVPTGCTAASPFVCANSMIAACVQSSTNRTTLATTVDSYSCPVNEFPVDIYSRAAICSGLGRPYQTRQGCQAWPSEKSLR